MNQVHKESLSNVENALPTRQSLDVEIFGMEGIPEEIVQQHHQRIIQNYYTAQAERRAATGNPPPGQSGSQGPAKKLKIEPSGDLKARLAEHRAQRAGAEGQRWLRECCSGWTEPWPHRKPCIFRECACSPLSNVRA